MSEVRFVFGLAGIVVSVVLLTSACDPGSRGSEDKRAGAGGSAVLQQPADASVVGASAGQGGLDPDGGDPPVEKALEPTADCIHPVVEAQCSEGFCYIPPGCYIFGGRPGEFYKGAYADRQVQITLTHGFYMGETEVTREQWESVGWPQPDQYSTSGTVEECVGPDCPQGDVSFYDVLSFANRYSELRGLPPCYELSECTGAVGDGGHWWVEPGSFSSSHDDKQDNQLKCDKVMLTTDSPYDCEGYRLPMEAEWEYAARAGTKTAFYSGDILYLDDGQCHVEPNLEPIGWYCANSDEKAHPVAQLLPNGWGLYDILGNMTEWCNDQDSPLGLPEGPLVDWPGPFEGRDITIRDVPPRIYRGGSCMYPSFAAKASMRVSFRDTAFGWNVGFRLVRTAPSEAH